MAYNNPELLFVKGDMHSTMEAHRLHSANAVQQIESNRLLNTPTADIVEQIVRTYRLDVPSLLRDQAEVDQHEGDVDIIDPFIRDRRGEHGTYKVTGTVVELTIPFAGDRDFFFIRPTTFNSAPPRAAVDSNQLVIRVTGRDLQQAQVKASLNRVIDDIEQYLGWLRSSADEFNAALPDRITKAVEDRKAKLLRDQNLVSDLGFNLKSRPDAPKTYAVPVSRKRIEPQKPVASAGQYKPEPALDDSNYRAILAIIENMTLVMERSPTAFAKMGEEDIRQHYLVQLNGQFEGAATGETFNFQGKTDILIRVDGKNIFIAECKFWRGEKSFTDTIDQILGYLSWRDTKAAILVFSRNKEFSSVLEKIVATVNQHPHKKRGPTNEADTRFRYVFGNPSDHNREIILTIMAFHIPSDDAK